MTGRGLSAVGTAILLLVVTAACTGQEKSANPSNASRAAGRGGHPLSVWTANVKYLQLRWEELVNRMARRGDGPQIVLLQEVERTHAKRFARVLGQRLEATFDSRWVEGDNAIAFRTDRFSLTHGGTSEREERNTLRWFSWGMSTRCDQRDRGQIALRLWDRAAGATLVVASVRWTHTTATACMEKNLETLDRELERRWPRRALTIVGGDFNSVADKRVTDGGAADVIAAGAETDPDCWYRAFTPVLEDALEHRRQREDGRDCADGPAANSYYDTVALASRAEGPDAVCRQWTYTRKLRARRGNSCTDTNGDGLRDRSRIDYIWARWEDARGRALSFSLAEASGRVIAAGADQACIDEGCARPRYSDHRASYAVVQRGSGG